MTVEAHEHTQPRELIDTTSTDRYSAPYDHESREKTESTAPPPNLRSEETIEMALHAVLRRKQQRDENSESNRYLTSMALSPTVGV